MAIFNSNNMMAYYAQFCEEYIQAYIFWKTIMLYVLKVLELYMSFESMNLLPEQCCFYAVRLMMLLIVN